LGKRKIGFKRVKSGGKSRKKKTSKISPVTLGFIVILIISLTAFFYINTKPYKEISTKSFSSFGSTNHDSIKPGNIQKKIIKEKKAENSPKLANLPKEKPPTIKPDSKIFDKEKPKVVIIVDDLGFNKKSVDKLLQIPAQLSFAILPHLPYSRYAAEMAHKNGRDVILHLPMEPIDSSGYFGMDAGEDALLVGLPKSEILDKLEKNMSSVPYIKGVNNHMGSKFTENSELMELILQRIKNRGLFFVDSRTSSVTSGFQIARRLGMKAAERDLFLDEGSQGASYVRSQIDKLISISKEKGYAIGICHPYPNTVKVLSELIPQMKKEVEIIPVSGVVN
jgi:polysaccharide deacetylase 2 family uncharacterized protein YibQ